MKLSKDLTLPPIGFDGFDDMERTLEERLTIDAKRRHNGFDYAALDATATIDPTADVEEPPSVILLTQPYSESVNICSLGSFSVVIGKAKSRKTFLLTAIAAAALKDGMPVIETIRGTMPPDKRAVAVFDTEQSHFYATRFARRICQMIGKTNDKNLRFRHLQPLTPEQRLGLISFHIENNPDTGLVIVDGIRDLLSNGINDESEATALTSKILNLVHTRGIHMIFVLHQNKNDLNARGHIGTEVINKAETVLSVTKHEKDKSISVVKAEYCRGIEPEPFNFTINMEGIPELASAPEGGKKNSSTITENFQYILRGQRIMNTSDLIKEYKELTGCSERTAFNHKKEAELQKIIIKLESGNYMIPLTHNDEDVPF